MGTSKGEYGEGNYKASREYNEKTKEFVESGKVDDAAREAAPQDDAEARELERAEREGKRRAKEEDPALLKRKDGEASVGTPITDRSAESTETPKPGQEAH
jgi:hypothetical protein